MPFFLIAQNPDTVNSVTKPTHPELNIKTYTIPVKEKRNFTAGSFIVPASLISYGFFAMGNNSLKALNVAPNQNYRKIIQNSKQKRIITCNIPLL